MSTHRRRFLRLCGVAGLGAVAGCSGGSEDGGTTTGTTGRIVADDGDSEDRFGISVAMSSDGTTALIGAFGDEDPNGEDAGSAYVFENSGGSWTQQAKLAADDGDGGDGFGISVALSNDGTTALIGASTDEDPNGADQYNRGAGSAYVFENSDDSWTQQAKLAADDGDGGDGFGMSVVMSSDGTTALIGDGVDDDPNGERAGSAYAFDNSGDSWTQRSKLVADDGERYDSFGSSVAMSSDGTIALIGAPFFAGFDDSGDEGPGSAYVLEL